MPIRDRSTVATPAAAVPSGRPVRAGLIAAAALLALTLAPPLGAAEIRGTVELSSSRGADVSEAVIYFEPASGARAVQPGSLAVMETKGKEFAPRVLPVTRGTTVRFPNGDPILHNVFSVSGKNRFDLGLYGKGEGKSWTFDTAGVGRIFCNVHHSMVGYVVVLETPYFAVADQNGDFSLTGLPAGPGKLTVWHPRTKDWSQTITPGGGPVSAQLEVNRRRIPKHLNKFGKSYRSRRGRYGG